MLKITLMLYRPEDPPDGDPAALIDLARVADEAGLHSLAMGEHVALGDAVDNYPYKGGLKQQRTSTFLEPVATLGAFAAVTRRIRLSTCIMLGALRPAVLLAKQLATLDVLSRGRMEPAVGMGWSREEYAALGIDFRKRRRILRDNIAACRAIWGEQPASFESETVSFGPIYSMPRPVQQRMPILIGLKASEENARIMAEVGDGWEIGPDDSRSPEALRDGIAMIHGAFSAAGRYPDSALFRGFLQSSFDASGAFDVERTLDSAAGLAELGVNRFILSSVGLGDSGATSARFARLIEDVGRAVEKY